MSAKTLWQERTCRNEKENREAGPDDGFKPWKVLC